MTYKKTKTKKCCIFSCGKKSFDMSKLEFFVFMIYLKDIRILDLIYGTE